LSYLTFTRAAQAASSKSYQQPFEKSLQTEQSARVASVSSDSWLAKVGLITCSRFCQSLIALLFLFSLTFPGG
jgi:hypothetical protein